MVMILFLVLLILSVRVYADSFGWCEAANTFKGCYDFGNESDCTSGGQCAWMEDSYGSYCTDKFFETMVSGMDLSPAFEIGSEECIASNESHVDICTIELKDGVDQFGIAIGVDSMADSVACSKFNPSSLNRTSKYYWYVDSDGNESKGCGANNDLSNLTGFEFKLLLTLCVQ